MPVIVSCVDLYYAMEITSAKSICNFPPAACCLTYLLGFCADPLVRYATPMHILLASSLSELPYARLYLWVCVFCTCLCVCVCTCIHVCFVHVCLCVCACIIRVCVCMPISDADSLVKQLAQLICRVVPSKHVVLPGKCQHLPSPT